MALFFSKQDLPFHANYLLSTEDNLHEMSNAFFLEVGGGGGGGGGGWGGSKKNISKCRPLEIKF